MGDLAMSFDSADDVYETALKARGVETKGVHPSAFPAMLKMLPVNAPKAVTSVAMDAAGTYHSQPAGIILSNRVSEVPK